MNTSEKEFLTVNQVADDLKFDYQKVLYLIKTNRIPAEKEGRAFKIPTNYRELMTVNPEDIKTRTRKKTSDGKKIGGIKGGQPKSKSQAQKQEKLLGNLVKAIGELVEFEVLQASKNIKPAAKKETAKPAAKKGTRGRKKKK